MNPAWASNLSSFGGPWILVVLIGMQISPALANDLRQCWANCLPDKQCKLSDAGKLSPDSTLKLDGSRPQLVQRCFERMVVEGRVVVRYMQARRLFVVPKPLEEQESVAGLLKTHPPDICSVPAPICLQKSMQGLKADVGGHGIDGQQSLPGGQGEPCSLGLPCGTVMAPAPAWQFMLADNSVDGTWRTRVLRGQPPAGVPAQAESKVAGGAVAADGSKFAPGITYAYVLVSRDGSTRASGEFTVQSASQHAALRRLVDRRIESGLPAEVAWLDALAANQLDWDAIQRIKP